MWAHHRERHRVADGDGDIGREELVDHHVRLVGPGTSDDLAGHVGDHRRSGVDGRLTLGDVGVELFEPDGGRLVGRRHGLVSGDDVEREDHLDEVQRAQPVVGAGGEVVGELHLERRSVRQNPEL